LIRRTHSNHWRLSDPPQKFSTSRHVERGRRAHRIALRSFLIYIRICERYRWLPLTDQLAVRLGGTP